MMEKSKNKMSESNEPKPPDHSQPTQSVVPPTQAAIVVGSNTEAQLQLDASLQPPGPAGQEYKWLKVYLIVCLIIFGLNTSLLALTFIPFAGVYIAIGASPILASTGILGLITIGVIAGAFFKHYVSDTSKKLAITVLVLCTLACLAAVPAVMVLKSMRTEEAKSQKLEQYYAQSEKTARSEATVEQATSLLNSCQVFGFYYTGQNGADGAENAEATKTGILLYQMPKSYDGTTTPASGDAGKYRMHIADRMVYTMVPIARKAQHSCGIQFWHDGNYEQWKNGQWYFNGQAVASLGNAKEETVSLMQSCKVDYFIGYTGDVNIVKDASSREWLQKAEQSSSGIEISENAPKTYVFVSKAMTLSLQDTARQARQTCYSQKKLYIMVDDWVETEYPAGKWTRVKQ